jgi:hypothetical protein
VASITEFRVTYSNLRWIPKLSPQVTIMVDGCAQPTVWGGSAESVVKLEVNYCPIRRLEVNMTSPTALSLQPARTSTDHPPERRWTSIYARSAVLQPTLPSTQHDLTLKTIINGCEQLEVDFCPAVAPPQVCVVSGGRHVRDQMPTGGYYRC